MTLLYKIKRFFKRDMRVYNVYHPDLKGKVEPAFMANGKQYYRYVKDVDMFWGRYMFMQTFLYEQNLRIDLPMLTKQIESIEKTLNGNAKGVIELGKVFQILGQIKSRCVLAFEVETTYRLASVIYFDDKEDLWKYDKAYNDKKIDSWMEAKMVDFFYLKPMKELLNLSDSLPADLVTYMAQQKEILGGLTLGTQEP